MTKTIDIPVTFCHMFAQCEGDGNVLASNV